LRAGGGRVSIKLAGRLDEKIWKKGRVPREVRGRMKESENEDSNGTAL